MTEAEFIFELKQGNHAAYLLLLEKHKLQVVNTCFKFLLVKEDAEDIAQEVFIEVFESIAKFRNDAKLSTWIYRIAVTKSLDELKKRKRKKRISSLGKLIGLEEISSELSGGIPADAQLESREQLKIIQNALDTLPENQRVAYSLSKIDGYSNADIADVMNTSISSVESLIKRAKKKMIEQLNIKS